MSVTLAPAAKEASATAKPCLPELLLEIYLTGSNASLVGPAVTVTLKLCSFADSSEKIL